MLLRRHRAGAGAAQALTPAQMCERLKNKAAGKRVLCVAKERGKEIAGKPFDYAGCTTKMADAFTAAETHAGGLCPTTGDAADIEARIDGVFNPSNAIPKALSAVRWVDNGDGTVTDTQTGLQWEKKDSLDGVTNFANPHDADNDYTWSNTLSDPDGTAFTDFLPELNDGCESADGTTITGGFAGHCDWRLPTSAELQTIRLAPYPCGTSPCINQTVFGPTQSLGYWSATTLAGNPPSALLIFFSNGAVDYDYKSLDYYVRAVRGGL